MPPAIETVLGAAVLAVAAVLGIRVGWKRPVRREIARHPWLAVVAFGFGLAMAAGLGIAARDSEAIRRFVLVGVAVATIFAIIRGRPRYGRRRRWPPGSLGLATSLDAVDDPGFYARAAQRWGSVFKMSQIHRPVACITDMRAGLELFQGDDGALGRSDWAFNRLVPGGYLEYMEGPIHGRYRSLFESTITAPAVRAGAAEAALAAREQLQEMEREGRAAHPPGVHPEPYLLAVPQRGLMKTFLGIGPNHARFEELSAALTDLNRPMELFLPAPRGSRTTYAELVDQIRQEGRRLTSGRVAENPSVLAHLARASPTALDDDTAIGNLVLMVKEGTIMVRGLLRWLVKMLGEHPEWVDRIRAVEPDSRAVGDHCRAFVHETIRLFESRYVYRRALRPVEFNGYVIPKGWLVRLCTGEAHEDPRVFERPQDFDPERFLATPKSADEFCPFGHGERACLGREPAVEIATAFVREATLGWDVRNLDDGPAWRINRHWGLWRPSLQLRVGLEPRRNVGDPQPGREPERTQR